MSQEGTKKTSRAFPERMDSENQCWEAKVSRRRKRGVFSSAENSIEPQVFLT